MLADVVRHIADAQEQSEKNIWEEYFNKQNLLPKMREEKLDRLHCRSWHNKKMKQLLTLLSFFCITFSCAQVNNCDSIPWTKERKLSWADFKATPDSSSKDTAQSFIRLHKKWSLRGDTLTITVSNYFKPCLAWSKSKNADTLLMHEQGHFDISEYFRRAAIKRFSEQNFKRSDLKAEIENIDLDIQAQQKQFIALYELKTDFSRNKAMQMEWTNKIQALLESLKEFDLPEVIKEIIK